MKTIGFVGLGKLGLPVALAVESKGYKVCGWDESQKVREGICAKKIPYNEKGAQEAFGEERN
jgi:UDP-N-acetyl-D-mannosaminuronate dehydrogenase